MRKSLRFVSLMLVLAMALTLFPAAIFAADEEMIVGTVDVLYGQTEARKMLDMINEFRVGTPGNPPTQLDENGQWVTVEGLEPLEYDAELEEIAMQRAAEIAVRFSHTRPNNEKWHSLYEKGKTTARGENIAAGNNTAQETFLQWREDDEDYRGQGHRRNMLNSAYNAIGIGYVEYGGQYYWTQALAKKNTLDTAVGSANDRQTLVQIQVRVSDITAKEFAADPSALEMVVEETVPLPTAEMQFIMQDTWPYNRTNRLFLDVQWSPEHSGIVECSGGNVTALAAGNTQLTADVPGGSIAVPVQVAGGHEHEYNGQWSSDAQTHWHECLTCGEKSDQAPHTYGEWVVEQEATESSTGLQSHSCTVCGYKETETIPQLEHQHQWGESWQQNAGEHWHECLTCGEKRDQAPHSYGEWVVEQEATENSTGLQSRSCTVCGYKETETIPQLEHQHQWGESWQQNAGEHWHECLTCGEKSDQAPHTYGEWVVEQEATENSTGLQSHSCTVCGYKETEMIPQQGPHQHQWESQWSRDTEHHWHECTVCGEKKDVAAHTPGYWQSNEEHHWKLCEVCKQQLDFAPHRFGDWMMESAPTETEDGIETRMCMDCAHRQGRRIPADKSNRLLLSGTVTSFLDEEEMVIVSLISPATGAVQQYTVLTGNNAHYDLNIAKECDVDPDVTDYKVVVDKADHVSRQMSVRFVGGQARLDLEVCPVGDVLMDGVVDTRDWMRLQDHLQSTNALTGYGLDCADTIRDGTVDTRDWMRLQDHCQGNSLW